jgi:hypothetical protein
MYTVSVTKAETMGKLCLDRFYYSKREGTEKKHQEKRGTPKETERGRKKRAREETETRWKPLRARSL